MKLCFYQVFWRDCKCTPDWFNQFCPKYIPITIWTFTAKGGKDEEKKSEQVKTDA
jgi:hypothetical protein